MAPKLMAAVMGPRVTSAMRTGRKVKPESPRNDASSPKGSVTVAAAATPKMPERNRRALKPTRQSSGEALGGGTLVAPSVA